MVIVLRDVEVRGRACSVTVADGRIRSVDPTSAPIPPAADRVIDGRGGALLPGLHDHHLHLMALAAWRESVDCTQWATVEGLVTALRQQPGAWVRAVGYHESLAGDLDRHVLDRWLPDRPIRMQHRSGALWMLNSVALDHVRHALDDSPDVERDPDGEPTGRLWRYDTRLRAALPATPPDLRSVGHELLALGVTGVTDATPQLDDAALRALRESQMRGDLPQSMVLLGVDTWVDEAGLRTGPRKIVVHDHALPDVDDLAELISSWHRAGRPVAIHTVSAEALVLTLAALDSAGSLPGDRLEHAAIVPAGFEPWLRALGVVVVTQPDFIRTRGDTYRNEVPEAEQPSLYRHATLLERGIPVVSSSDAPYGDLDPWAAVKSARDRLTADGHVLGQDEIVVAATTLHSYLRDPLDLTAAPRQVTEAASADLCLLHTPLREALTDPRSDLVRLTLTS